ncbi:MAG: NADPH-dependent F420 reductase [Candidatus Caldarchaeum sp.]|uniref:NADPH-dependent F420 reductase n=1 Tax=Caldiarchaeum subterraneum TaxID=311458 RepID=A0A7J3VUN1_CALS0
MKVAVVGGTGDLGFGLVLRLARAGVEVVIGSRDEGRAWQAARRAVEILGDALVSGASNRHAGKGCKVVFFTIPYEALAPIVEEVAAGLEKDCIAVSCIVPPAGVDGSAAEHMAGHLPKSARVVAALHTVSASIMQDLDRAIDSDTFVFGDGFEEKKTVAGILRLLPGLRPVDGGPLKNSKYGEVFTRFLIGVNKRYGMGYAGLKVTGLRDDDVWRKWGF